MPSSAFDIAIVGAGIVGMAHAWAARREGLSVVVIDRDERAIGASIRNFGFVTVTGQGRGETWARARRTAELWAQIAPEAGISIQHRGLLVAGRREECRPVFEAFLATEMGAGCELLTPHETGRRFPMIAAGSISCGLWSPHDLRVESRTALPLLASWLQEQGVAFLWGAHVRDVQTGRIETSHATIRAQRIIVCTGDDLPGLFPDEMAARGVTRSKLQMMRLADPGWRLPSSIMSDLGLVRYRGYAELEQTQALRERLCREQAAHLSHGVHLIVVQSADGTLVVGDSHHYGNSPDPFSITEIDDLILDAYAQVLGAPPPVVERWTGTYASAAGDMFRAQPLPDVWQVVITSGTGASTAFAIAEETVHGILGQIREKAS